MRRQWTVLTLMILACLAHALGQGVFPKAADASGEGYTLVDVRALKKMSAAAPQKVCVTGVILFFAWDFGDGYDAYLFADESDIKPVDINKGVKVVIPAEIARGLKEEGLVKSLNKKRVTVFGEASSEKLFAHRETFLRFKYMRWTPSGKAGKPATR